MTFSFGEELKFRAVLGRAEEEIDVELSNRFKFGLRLAGREDILDGKSCEFPTTNGAVIGTVLNIDEKVAEANQGKSGDDCVTNEKWIVTYVEEARANCANMPVTDLPKVMYTPKIDDLLNSVKQATTAKTDKFELQVDIYEKTVEAFTNAVKLVKKVNGKARLEKNKADEAAERA